MRKKILLILAFSALLFYSTQCYALNFFAVEDVPTYDACFWRNVNFNNFSDDLDSELWTGNFWGNNDTRSYLKFDIAQTSNVQSAMLWLYSGVESGWGSSYQPAEVFVYSTPTYWDETTTTWQNQPPVGTLGGHTTVGSTAGWYYWDVTSLVQSAGENILSFALASDGPGHVFYARETQSGFAPYLQISVIPEPVSSVLFLLGGVSLITLRRRKNTHQQLN
ncbi:MAG: PEP-CTERM sorting domain-containing protein [Candidatus Omnitrophica bacterium]|nr:PEP-CTERM sorting domain-containing protein [Candidatus Omnitrophota bacterium]